MIYAEPLLSEICTNYPTRTSIVTVPKVEITATVQNSDSTTTTYNIPRATQLVRGATEDITLTPNANNDLFGLSAGPVSSSTTRINKRYLVIDSVLANDGTSNIDVSVVIRPDARGQLEKEFTFTSGAHTVTGKMIGNVNWDSGVITFAVTYEKESGDTNTYTTTSANARVMFSPTSGDVGRVKVKMKMSGWDIDVGK